MSAPRSPSPSARFAVLAERAHALLVSSDRPASDAEVATTLFGPLATGRWAAMVTTVLGADPRFVRDEGGWRLAGSAEPAEPADIARTSGAAAELDRPGTSRDGPEGTAGARLTPAATAVTAAGGFPVHTARDGVAGSRRSPRASGLAPLPLPLGCDVRDIATVALATSGADPHRHRIVRIAGVRRRPDGATTRFDVLVHPRRRLARYLVDGTGIARDELDAAPPFADHVPALVAFLEGARVFAYGSAWVTAFLVAEARRAGVSGLALQIHEIDGVARAVLAPDRKPGLSATASALGLHHPQPGHPVADAEVALHVLARLLASHAAPATGTAIDAARETTPLPAEAGAPPAEARGAPASAREAPPCGDAAAGPGAVDIDPAGHDSEALDLSATRAAWPDDTAALPFSRTWLESVPHLPGVYLVEDADGAPLYIGKATDLRQRLAAYIGPAPALHRRLEALAVRGTSVQILPTPSDLEAAILEDRLIREHAPPFNVARQIRALPTILRSAPHDTPPRIRLVEESAPDGATYFGPYRGANIARQAYGLARALYPDACRRTLVDLEGQRAAVLDATRLLAGQIGPALASVREQMGAAASRGDAAAVDRTRGLLRDIHALDLSPSPRAGLPLGWGLLVVEPAPAALGACGPRRAHLIVDGRRVGSADLDGWGEVSSASGASTIADEIAARAGAAGATPADAESVVVRRWLAQAHQRITIVRVPPPRQSP